MNLTEYRRTVLNHPDLAASDTAFLVQLDSAHVPISTRLALSKAFMAAIEAAVDVTWDLRDGGR